jgi:hypothetical protein
MHFSLKLKARDPFAEPVIPIIPETSPMAFSLFFKKGFPAFGSTKAIVFNTVMVPSKKGLIKSAFMMTSLLLMHLVYYLVSAKHRTFKSAILQIFLFFSPDPDP